MLKSLLWKELRELLPLIAVAVATQVFLIAGLMRFWALSGTSTPRDADAIWPMLYITAVVFAIAAGLWQIWREGFGDYFQFLLHRPVKREIILGAKLAFGAATCLLIVGLPLLCFAAWSDGMVTDRYRPWTSMAARQLCASILLLYLGAALSALRPGRWYGSRFLPLFAGILLYAVLQSMADISSWWWSATLAVAPLLELCFVIAILHVARTRDFS